MVAVAGILAVLFLFPVSSCVKHAGTGEILCCSTSAVGDLGNHSSYRPAISADGRYVAFHSQATNLVPGDDNGWQDVFRKDLETGEIVLCSASASGEPGNGDSGYPSISGDGRYVVFESRASNLVPGDRNDRSDVFRKDLETGEIVRCSASSDGVEGNGHSERPSISLNGRYVAFHSSAINLFRFGIDNHVRDLVYLKDLETGELACCSTSSGGEPANADSQNPDISRDGRYVVFESFASNLVPGTTSMDLRIFRKDLETGELICCSTSPSGELGNGGSRFPKISGDGRYVVFLSNAGNLTPDGKASAGYSIYRKDLATGEVVRCSDSPGVESEKVDSGEASISADGRFVAFVFYSSRVKPRYSAARLYLVYVKDLETGCVLLCSTSTRGRVANGSCGSPSVSSDGRYVAFDSEAGNLTRGDDNETCDVFRKEISF